MKKIIILLILFTVFAFVPNKELKAQSANLERKTIESWMYYLSSDSMRGRKNGSPENKIAAAFIAKNFKESGLDPFTQNDTYFQHYFIKSGKKDSIPEVNVIGYIEGSDPVLKKEFIVVSAHFDHIGVGKPVAGDSIYNGANDNASGVSGVMGVAKLFHMMNAKPLRSVVFITFSGEELGLRGSHYFCGHPDFPITSIYLNINFEMIGHCTVLGKNKFMITGPDLSNLKGIINDYDKNQNWQLVDTVKSLKWLFYDSDNASFANAKRANGLTYGVPAHTFVIWNGENHLHKPNDEAKYFDFDNMTNFIQYMAGLTLYLANDKEPIVWTDSHFKRLEN